MGASPVRYQEVVINWSFDDAFSDKEANVFFYNHCYLFIFRDHRGAVKYAQVIFSSAERFIPVKSDLKQKSGMDNFLEVCCFLFVFSIKSFVASV